MLFLPLRFIYPAYSAINALIFYVYYVPITFQLVNSTQHFQSLRQLDLGVAAVKSTDLTWDVEVKSSHLNFKSPSKFFAKVAAKFLSVSHDFSDIAASMLNNVSAKYEIECKCPLIYRLERLATLTKTLGLVTIYLQC